MIDTKTVRACPSFSASTGRFIRNIAWRYTSEAFASLTVNALVAPQAQGPNGYGTELNMARAKNRSGIGGPRGTTAKMRVYTKIDPDGSAKHAHAIRFEAYEDALDAGIFQRMIDGPLYETRGLFRAEDFTAAKPFDLLDGAKAKNAFRSLKMFLVNDALCHPFGTYAPNPVASSAHSSFLLKQGRPVDECLGQQAILGSVLIETCEMWPYVCINDRRIENYVDAFRDLCSAQERFSMFRSNLGLLFCSPDKDFLEKIQAIIPDMRCAA